MHIIVACFKMEGNECTNDINVPLYFYMNNYIMLVYLVLRDVQHLQCFSELIDILTL